MLSAAYGIAGLGHDMLIIWYLTTHTSGIVTLWCDCMHQAYRIQPKSKSENTKTMTAWLMQ